MSSNPCMLLKDELYTEAIRSIHRVDEKGYLYEMTCNYDCYSLPKEFQAIIDAGCSTFFTPNLNGEYLLCRNYDYSHYLKNDKRNPRTGINMIVHNNNPKAKYRSLGVADMFWLDYQNGTYGEGCGDDGKSDLSGFVIAPFLCMDGINEAGLGVSIMALSNPVIWEEIEYSGAKDKMDAFKINPILEIAGELPDPQHIYASEGSICVNEADQKAWIAHMTSNDTHMPGKPAVLPPIMMRMILDQCSTVEEGVAFADRFNIKSVVPGSDYHIMIVDAAGNSRLLEWVDNHMNVIDINHATNYRVSADDGFHGVCGRDECIKAGLFRSRKNGMREDYAETLLKMVHQDPTNGMDRGKTQYSCIYNTKLQTLKIFSYGDFSVSWNYKL